MARRGAKFPRKYGPGGPNFGGAKFPGTPVVVIDRLSIKKVVKCYSRILKLDLPMLTNGGSLNPRNFIPQVDRLSCKDSKDCYEFLPFEIVKL